MRVFLILGLVLGLSSTLSDAGRKTVATAKKTTPIVVAVVDTGVDETHPLLKGIVSKFGWDYVTNKPAKGDYHGHGTHVAGIINSVSSGKALIFPIRYYSDKSSGTVNMANSTRALKYAVDHGANIINYSGGGPEFSEAELGVLKYAEAYGVLVVAAAGNEGKNVDLFKSYYYPASYRLSNIISVASITSEHVLAQSSNYGNTVDLAAVGVSVYSTLPGDKYGPMSGTSQATAVVTGIATLVWSKCPHLTATEVKRVLLDTAVLDSSLRGKVAHGRPDADAALKSCTKRNKAVYYEKE